MDAASLAIVVLSGLVLLASPETPPSTATVVRYGVLGALACVALMFRRRHPVAVGLITAVLAALTPFGPPAAAIALFGVAVHRRASVAWAVAAANLVSASLVNAYRPPQSSWLWPLAISALFIVATVMLGMFVRARRQLISTLNERAVRAEAEQRLLAEQARANERTRIAREMHDVLGHRISMVALHAGGLELNPDLPPEQVRETARLLRTTARQALEELREVIGVLREDGGEAPDAPQPTLADIPRLVEETRQAHEWIELAMAVTAEPPGPLGRDAYRIVQEALTNVAKHAAGETASVQVRGAPGDGLLVEVRNRRPPSGSSPAWPGSGAGLLGLEERVGLAGGTLTHGWDDADEFVVKAQLPWS